jgi:hypothetical protein
LKTAIKAFEGLFENAPPVPPDFNLDQPKWKYFKEKYNIKAEDLCVELI